MMVANFGVTVLWSSPDGRRPLKPKIATSPLTGDYYRVADFCAYCDECGLEWTLAVALACEDAANDNGIQVEIARDKVMALAIALADLAAWEDHHASLGKRP